MLVGWVGGGAGWGGGVFSLGFKMRKLLRKLRLGEGCHLGGVCVVRRWWVRGGRAGLGRGAGGGDYEQHSYKSAGRNGRMGAILF